MHLHVAGQAGLRGLLAGSTSFGELAFGAEGGVDAEDRVTRRTREVAAQLAERVRKEMRALPFPTCVLHRSFISRLCLVHAGCSFSACPGPCVAASQAPHLPPAVLLKDGATGRLSLRRLRVCMKWQLLDMWLEPCAS